MFTRIEFPSSDGDYKLHFARSDKHIVVALKPDPQLDMFNRGWSVTLEGKQCDALISWFVQLAEERREAKLTEPKEFQVSGQDVDLMLGLVSRVGEHSYPMTMTPISWEG